MSCLAGRIWWLALTPALLAPIAVLPLVVPTEIQQPGTQPGEVSSLGAVSHCDNCHGGYDQEAEPAFNWRGSMMAHASRDPIFWATMAVAEQDFPGSGDLCLRCHTPRAWLEGRSEPTDGSALTDADVDGLECAICHKMVDPDGSEHLGEMFSPFLAHNEGSPAVGYYGSGMMAMWEGNERMGPYATTTARHAYAQSLFHRSAEFCGTCHDVSNPAVGDLAHNHGAQVPLQPGTFSGVLGSAVETKAAFNNFPHAYGIVERTFSEHMASRWPGTLVSSYMTVVPQELQDGAVEAAWNAAQIAGTGGNYEDGTDRFFTCQTCHVPPISGKGANKHNTLLRRDLPLHDLTGGNYWMPDAIRYLDALGRLRVGGGLSQLQRDALEAGKQRARTQLDRAASLSTSGDTVRVLNLTGHKLISGYPEGRRMWLRVRWRDALRRVLRTDGAYGPLLDAAGDPVTVTDPATGLPVQVESIRDLDDPNTVIYQAKPGITQEWANQLLAVGTSSSLALEYDRETGAPAFTLGQVAAGPPGSAHASFRFVLNNTVIGDNRIPPWGMSYDEAQTRNALPVPASQFGAPGPQGTYEHWHDFDLTPPPRAVYADVELLYQPTSWEYVQFLSLANDRQHAFHASLGDDLLEAWLHTGMAAPHRMASTFWCRLPGTGDDLQLSTQVNGLGDALTCAKVAEPGDRLEIGFTSPGGAFHGEVAALLFEVYPTGLLPIPRGSLPGLQLSTVHGVLVAPAVGETRVVHHVSSGRGERAVDPVRTSRQVATPALPPGGIQRNVAVLVGLGKVTMRVQGVVLSPLASNGAYATSDAHDIRFESS